MNDVLIFYCFCYTPLENVLKTFGYSMEAFRIKYSVWRVCEKQVPIMNDDFHIKNPIISCTGCLIIGMKQMDQIKFQEFQHSSFVDCFGFSCQMSSTELGE